MLRVRRSNRSAGVCLFTVWMLAGAAQAADRPNAGPSHPVEHADRSNESSQADRSAALGAVAKHRITYDVAAGLRVNPIGLELQFQEAYRFRLYESHSLPFRENGVSFGIASTVNPAVLRFGPMIEFRPATFLALSAAAYHMAFTGLSGHVQTYDDPGAAHSDSDLSRGAEQDLHQRAFGFELVPRALLLLKLGPIALRNDFQLYYTSLNLPFAGSSAEKNYFYTPRTDMLLANRGFSLTQDTDLAWVSDFGLVAGARFALGHAFYPGADLESAENKNTPIARLGPLIAYTFFDKPGASFNKPTVLGLFNFYLAHRYRTGQDVTQALPYMLLAFRFEGELWRSP